MWRLMAGQTLRYRCWDDEYVLYNDLSGDTHLLGPDAVLILQTLQQRPATLPQLAAALALDDEESRQVLGDILAQLHSLHLIDRLAC